MSMQTKSEALLKLLDSTDPVETVNSILSNPQIVDKLKQALLAPEKEEQSLHVFRCEKCKYGSHSYAEWIYHTHWHEESNGCPLCDYKSSSDVDYERHMAHHSESLKHKCTHCPYMTCTQTLLYEHTRLVHNTSYSQLCHPSETTAEVMSQHKATHYSGSTKPRTVTSRKRSAKPVQLKESEAKRLANNKSSKESAPLQTKIEPIDVYVPSYNNSTTTDNETPPALQNDTTPGVGENVPNHVAVSADRRPWWNTKTEILPPQAADVVERAGNKESLQCASCGNYYTGDASSHQCAVVKPTLTSCTHMCCLCDFYTGDKKALMEHHVVLHSRVWSSLILRVSHSYPTLEYLCDAVETLVPGRYKSSADNVWVTRTNGEDVVQNTSSSGVSLYRCTKCFKSFPSLDLQAGHKLLDQCEEVVRRYQYGCAACKMELSTSDEGLTHHLQHHTTMNAIKPEEINSRATEDALLMVEALQKVGAEDHNVYGPSMIQAKIVAGGYEMCCQLCPYTTDHTDKYVEHTSANHWTCADRPAQHSVVVAAYSTLYGCNLCSYICEDTCSLSSHLTSHAGASRRATRSKSSHKSTSVGDGGLNTSVDSSADSLTVSADVASSADLEQTNQLLCTVCGFQTTSKSSLRSHSLRHLKNRLQCEQCSFTTTHASTLTIHMRSHTGYRPFVCSMCGKGFTTNSELRKHERRHAGLIERKFLCDMCSKSYSTPQHLKVHKRLHTGDRPFKCSLCTFAATSKCVLVNHMATHTGEKNYKCHLCDFSCASSGTLSNHRRLKHNIVNKRKTLAETTPESILMAAKVAGKSKRVKPGSGSTSSTAATALNKQPQSDAEVSTLPGHISADKQSEKEAARFIPQQTATSTAADPPITDIMNVTSNVQPQLSEQVSVYQIIQTGSADYQMVGEVHATVS